MAQPRYTPEALFRTLPATEEVQCFYCNEPTSPDEKEYFRIGPPDGEWILNLHVVCFEELAWMMFNYYFAYVQRKKLASTLN